MGTWLSFSCQSLVCVCVCVRVWWAYVWKHKTAKAAQAAWEISYTTDLVLTRGDQLGKQNLSYSDTYPQRFISILKTQMTVAL